MVVKGTIWYLLIVIAVWLEKVSTAPAVNGKEKKPNDYSDYYDDDVLNLIKEGQNSKPLIPSVKDLSLMPACQKECTHRFSETLNIAFRAGNHYERFNEVCKKYGETLDCISNLESCSNHEQFDIMTSGLKYMCIDQRKAFEDHIECIDASANKVTMECNNKCNTHGKFIKWTMQSGIFNAPAAAPADDGDIFSKFNPEMMRGVLEDSCEMMRCHLGCMKNAFNAQCKGNAGTLLSEMFVRPIAVGQQVNSFTAFTSVMGMFMPHQCSFIVNEHDLSPFRIDSKLDQQLRNQAEVQDMTDAPELDAELNVTTTSVVAEVPTTVPLVSIEAATTTIPLNVSTPKIDDEYYNWA